MRRSQPASKWGRDVQTEGRKYVRNLCWEESSSFRGTGSSVTGTWRARWDSVEIRLSRPPRPRPETWILFQVQCEDTEGSYDRFHESHGPLCLIQLADLKTAEMGKCSVPRPLSSLSWWNSSECVDRERMVYLLMVKHVSLATKTTSPRKLPEMWSRAVWLWWQFW